MTGRYELSDQLWQMIKDIVSPPQTQTMGRPCRDDRQVLNDILWFFAQKCSGTTCRCVMALGILSINASANGVIDGTFYQILARLQLKLREDVLMDLG